MILCSSAKMALNVNSIPLYINLTQITTQKSRYICHESSKSSGTPNKNYRPQSNEITPGDFSLKETSDKSNSELKGGFLGESVRRSMKHNTSVIGADTNVNPHQSLRISSYSCTLVLSTSQGDASEDGSKYYSQTRKRLSAKVSTLDRSRRRERGRGNGKALPGPNFCVRRLFEEKRECQFADDIQADIIFPR